MTLSRVGAASVPVPRLAAVFLGFFGFVLAGYAIVGRGFAYFGFPPLYIGEMALALGILASLAAGNLVSAVFNVPGLALVLLMLWTAIRTVPYLGEYGIDSLRDSVIAFYGLFSFIIASLILQRPLTLSILISRYKRFIPLMVFLAPVSLGLSLMYPEWPNVRPLFEAKAGDVSCHLVAICAFALVGFTRLQPLTLLTMLPTALVASAMSREAMVSFVIGCSLGTVLSPSRRAPRQMAMLIGIVVVALTVAVALDIRWSNSNSGRQIAVRQLVVNAASIFGHSDSEENEGTKEWRLNWWSDIVAYTVHGPYFWTGKGFGINLADSDDYQAGNTQNGEAPTRSPHNVHMTILARAGVPGLILWAFALSSWFVAISRQFLAARQSSDVWWMRMFGFLLSFWTVLVVSSSFDVAFEGPVRGIWFWTIHGIGIAAIVLHRHRLALRRTRRDPGSRAERSIDHLGLSRRQRWHQ
jgi:hypothetical protein